MIIDEPKNNWKFSGKRVNRMEIHREANILNIVYKFNISNIQILKVLLINYLSQYQIFIKRTSRLFLLHHDIRALTRVQGKIIFVKKKVRKTRFQLLHPATSS